MREGTTRAQGASSILMVRPAAFGFNETTAVTNTFQTEPGESREVVHRRAVSEFDTVAAAIREAGVEVIIIDDSPMPVTPDAVFPNNWISTHHDGTVVLYPMQAPNRRLEQRDDVVESLGTEHGFDVRQVIDLGRNSAQGRYLEGTGSLVFDHRNRVAFACLSPRTDRGMVYEAEELLGYECVVFRATSVAAQDVYHTNVVMSIGDEFAVVCADAIVEDARGDGVVGRLRATGRQVVELSREQMASFAANILELRGRDGEPVLAVSTRGWNALNATQRNTLANLTRIVSLPIPTIESVGGGGIRCMIAEIFLPRHQLRGSPGPAE